MRMEDTHRGGITQQALASGQDSKISPHPHDKRRPITILDLPTEVLRKIFDYFQDANATAYGRLKWRVRWTYRPPSDDGETNRRQTLQSARLACRHFHQLVSPLLCQILQVRLDQASLDRADNLSRSPLIAAGVRGIQVVLHYRPKELAESLSLFKDYRKKALEQMSSRCDYYAETWFLGGYDESDDTICPQPLREYLKAMKHYQSICQAWDDCVSTADVKAKDAGSLEYQRVLRQSHEEYRQKHEEQLRLITDGSFVNVLASSISRMAHYHYPCPYTKDPTLWVDNLGEMSRFMVTPHDWRAIEGLERGPGELPPVKLLSELPIAIYKAGTALRELHISCFPLNSNYSMLCPGRDGRLGPAWADLQAACQQLEKFDFGRGSLNRQPVQCGHFLVEGQPSVDQYLGTILSGQNLKAVHLDLGAFGRYRIGPALGAMSPRIRQAYIKNASLTQDELDAFCNNTQSQSRLELIALRGVELLSGGWSGALDVLREKVLLSGRHLGELKCTVLFSRLTGGEFGKKKKKKKTHISFKSWHPKGLGSRKEPLLEVLSAKYVSGVEEGVQNPLKDIRVRGPLG